MTQIRETSGQCENTVGLQRLGQKMPQRMWWQLNDVHLRFTLSYLNLGDPTEFRTGSACELTSLDNLNGQDRMVQKLCLFWHNFTKCVVLYTNLRCLLHVSHDTANIIFNIILMVAVYAISLAISKLHVL